MFYIPVFQVSYVLIQFYAGEARYVDSYHHFINNKDSIDMLFLKFLFLGPPRLGKTTACRRLMGKIIDLKSAGEARKHHPSTRAVESEDVMVRNVSNTAAVVTKSEWSAVASLNDEARILFHSLVDSIENKTNESHKASKSNDAITHSHPTKTIGKTTSFQRTTQSPEVATKSVNQVADVSYSHPSSEVTRGHKAMPEVTALFRKVMGSHYWKDVKHMFKAYLRMEDTGGQPELMDMLPALTVGPGVYLLFINLQNDLDHHFKLTYFKSSHKKTPPTVSSYTVKELLLSSMSSISCSNASFSANDLDEEEASSPVISDVLESSKSVAYIVGTHKDKVTKERITEINEQLKKIIKSTYFYDKDIVQFISEENLIVTMDNMGGGAEEVDQIHKLLEKGMEKHFKKLRIPAVWLFFSLFLRDRDMKTAPLDYCLQLSEQLNMSSYETKVALWFLHHHAGVLMYFPNIPELKDLVIIDVQIVYDSVTILILRAMSFDKVGHKNAEEFKKTGKFVLSHITAPTTKISGDHIPPLKLVALLEYLHIIARIFAHSQEVLSLASPNEEEVTFIMPCVLQNATKEVLDSKEMVPAVSPLMVRYKCGFVPIGVFPAMIAYLIASKSFRLIQQGKEGIFKNFVQFRYGPRRTLLTFICCSTYYEVVISKFATGNVMPHMECEAIRKEVEYAFTTISSRVKYGSFVDYQFAFDCPLHPGNSREHLCVVDKAVDKDETIPEMMDCHYNPDNPEPVELDSKHKVWFGQVRIDLYNLFALIWLFLSSGYVFSNYHMLRILLVIILLLMLHNLKV